MNGQIFFTMVDFQMTDPDFFSSRCALQHCVGKHIHVMRLNDPWDILLFLV